MLAILRSSPSPGGQVGEAGQGSHLSKPNGTHHPTDPRRNFVRYGSNADFELVSQIPPRILTECKLRVFRSPQIFMLSVIQYREPALDFLHKPVGSPAICLHYRLQRRRHKNLE